MKKLMICLTLIVILTASAVYADSAYYTSGDSVFSIRLGSDFPFLMKLNGQKPFFYGTEKDRIGLTPAITGSLSYEVFLNSKFTVGGELGYQLNFSRSDESYFTQVPITAKASYRPIQTKIFDLCFNANFGYAYIKFPIAGKADGTSALYASVSAEPVYFFTESWGLGLEAGFSTIVELHTIAKTGENGLLCLAPVNLVINYRH